MLLCIARRLDLWVAMQGKPVALSRGATTLGIRAVLIVGS